MKNQNNSTNSTSSKNNIEELKKRAEQGDAEAQYDLALNYEQGWDVYQNNQKAVEWYTKAAENGYVMAQRRLANCYKTGTLGLEKDYKKALYWYEKTGKSIDEDSIESCKKGVLAEEGDAEAQYQLGMCYAEGKGVKQNLEKAIEIFEKIQDKLDSLDIDENKKAFVKNAVLAEKGDAEAQYQLGNIYSDFFESYRYGISRNWQIAIEWYAKAAKQGHVKAQYQLGNIYFFGSSEYGISRNWQKAIEWYAKAAKQGHAKAQYRLDKCYAEAKDWRYTRGRGVDQDWQKDVGWFEKFQNELDSKNKNVFVKNAVLAEKGDAEAQYQLGNIYSDFFESYRYGINQDLQKAVEWYAKAADQGHAKAQYQLGMCYAIGRGVDQDWQKAVGWFEKIQDKLDCLDIDDDEKAFVKNAVLAEKGDAEAQCQLGFFYSFYAYSNENDYGVKQDWQKAVEWYAKAAKQGHVKAQYQLGMCYAIGEGVDRDWQKAVGWFEKIQDKLDYLDIDENKKAFVKNAVLAEKGDAEAQCQLGFFYSFYAYSNENDYGVKQDWQKAIEWYTKAAEQGYAEAQYTLGMRYAEGKGVKQDWQKAIEWYTKAAEQGYAEAQYKLGICYVKGEGVDRDWQKAVGWFEKIQDKLDYLDIDENKKAFVKNAVLAEKGDAEAQYQLGLCLAGFELWDESFDCFTKAANMDHAGAQYRLGLCYDEGKGVDHDWQKAFEWYTKAVKQGHAEAHYQLGMCYALGRGVGKNFKYAKTYFENIRDRINDLNISTNEKTFINKVILGKPSDAETMYQLGVKYLKAGQDARAKVCLHRAAYFGVDKAKGLL